MYKTTGVLFFAFRALSGVVTLVTLVTPPAFRYEKGFFGGDHPLAFSAKRTFKGPQRPIFDYFFSKNKTGKTPVRRLIFLGQKNSEKITPADTPELN